MLGLHTYLGPARQAMLCNPSLVLRPCSNLGLPAAALKKTCTQTQSSSEHKRARSPEHSKQRAVRQRLMSPPQQSLATSQPPTRTDATGQAVLSLQQQTSQPSSQPQAVPAGGKPPVGGSQQQQTLSPVGGKTVPETPVSQRGDESSPPTARGTGAVARQQGSALTAAAANGASPLKELPQSANPTSSDSITT